LVLLVVAVANAAVILHADKEEKIDNEWLVIFHTNVTDEQAALHYSKISSHPLWKAAKNEILAKWHIDAFRGYHAFVSTQAAFDLLLSSPELDFVEPNGVVRKFDSDACTAQSNAPWGLARLNLNDIPANNAPYNWPSKGPNNVFCYVIDTGIRIDHTNFGGRAIYGASFIAGITNPNDDNGHGTHVAGTVGGNTYGVSKFVTLVAVKVLSAQGSGTNAGVVNGIDWSANDSRTKGRKGVANLSLGGGASTATDNAINALINAGVTTVVAAGNEQQSACNVSPARVPNAITVAACDRSDLFAYFSNHGTCVNINGPGVSILSAWHTSTTATNTISGTSMAAPHIAGLACLYAEHTSSSGLAINNLVYNSATKPRIGDLKPATTNAYGFSQWC